MSQASDARVPLVLGSADMAGPGDALLIGGDARVAADGPVGRYVPRASGAPPATHVPGCDCCRPRAGAAMALAVLFFARARGGAGDFRRVVAVPCDAADAADLRRVVATDPFVAGRFRLADG